MVLTNFRRAETDATPTAASVWKASYGSTVRAGALSVRDPREHASGAMGAGGDAPAQPCRRANGQIMARSRELTGVNRYVIRRNR